MPKVHEFHFTKSMDKSSPVLFLSCCQGQIHPEAILTARRANPTGQTVEHLKYKFSNVMVTSVNPVCANAQLDAYMPLEEVTLAFTKCELDYTYFLQSGDQGGNYHGGWNIAANTTV